MFKNQFDSKLYFYDQFDIKLQRLRINLSLKYYSHDQFLALFVYLITKFEFFIFHGSICHNLTYIRTKMSIYP